MENDTSFSFPIREYIPIILILVTIGWVGYIILYRTPIKDGSPIFTTYLHFFKFHIQSAFSSFSQLVYENPLSAFLLVSAKVAYITSFVRQYFHKKWVAQFPVIGIPEKENITILMMLFKIRCLETATMYEYIRERQQTAQAGDWIKTFIDDEFCHYYYGPILYFNSVLENEKLKNDVTYKKKMLQVQQRFTQSRMATYPYEIKIWTELEIYIFKKNAKKTQEPEFDLTKRSYSPCCCIDGLWSA